MNNTPEEIADAAKFIHAVTTDAAPTEIAAISAAIPGPRYELGEEIARGGMGVIYLAVDAILGREVAVKVLQQRFGPDSSAAHRFADEARITGQLQHPAIPPVHDLGTLPDGRPFLAMKLIRGQTLEALLAARQQPTIDRGRFVAVFEHVCHALAYAHSHNVVHRDLKPANVMVGGFGEVQVMDWGLAKVLSARQNSSAPNETVAQTEIRSARDSDGAETQAGSLLGTPAYMPPEQAVGAVAKINVRSDVFGLGGILAAVLTGQPPFAAGSSETTRLKAAQGQVGECFARLDASSAEPELVTLCKRCLSPDPADRPADANEVAAAVAELRQAAEERARQAEMDRVRTEERRKRRRTQLSLAAATVGLILAAGFGTTVATLWRSAERARGAAVTAQGEAEAARERLAAVEYGRTMQVAYREWCENNAGATIDLLASTRPEFRGWEYHYLDRLCHADLLTLRGHASQVQSAAFSPDGLRVVTCGYDNTVRVWDAKSGTELLALKLNDPHGGEASFSPDGSRIMASGQGKTARVWDASTGTEVVAQTFDTGEDFGLGVYRTCFSPDGSRVVTISGNGQLRVWDANTRAELVTLEGTKGPVHTAEKFIQVPFVVTSVSFSRDGSRVAVGGWTESGRVGTARVWDTRTGAELLTLKGHEDQGHSAAISPDGSRVVTSGRDGTALVWDVRTRAELLALKGHARQVDSTSFSSDGSQVLTAGRDGTARVWDAGTGNEVLVFKGHAGDVISARFSPDGSRVVTAGADGTARVWDAKTRSEVPPLHGHASEILGASFSADGARVVTASGDGTVRAWDVRSGAEMQAWPFDKDRGWVNSYRVAFSSDGTRVVTGSNDGKFQVWDAKTGAELLALKGILKMAGGVAFSPDGSRIATVSINTQIWDARTGAELHKFAEDDDFGHAIAFNPDGTRLVTFHSNRANTALAKVWDAGTGARLLATNVPGDMSQAVSFSPDGSHFITGGSDGSARVWDGKTGAELLVLQGHSGPVVSVSFSPDGTRVITGGNDGAARLWDARTGVEVMTLKAHSRRVTSASFSQDGNWIVTASADGSARVWGVRPVQRPNP